MNLFQKIKNNVAVKLKFSELEFTFTKPRLDFSLRTICAIACFLSGLAIFITYKLNLIVAYNDARAHMNMARLAIDNLKPGLAQIGSVWLPLNHLLTLTLVWNDWLWQTGLAGAFFSMIAYLLSTVYMYKLLKMFLKQTFPALLGTLFFATNLNILYMQSTPMTELLLLLFFIASTFYLYLWIQSQKTYHLIELGVTVFLATITRYDGWFLFIVVSIIVGFVSISHGMPDVFSLIAFLKNARKNWASTEGKLILFITLACFGIALWLLWNLVIFGNAFYFAYGPYSAHAQQARIEEAGALPTKHNLPLSLAAYWWATVNNAGFLPTIFAIFGFVIFAYKFRLKSKALAIYTLLVPLIFHVFSLFQGHSILILPELGVNITEEARTSWFNVRYGLMMVPAVAFFAGFLAAKDKMLKLALIALLIIQPILFFSSKNIITITDGLLGTSSLAVSDVRDWLKVNAQNDEGLILTSISYHNALAFSTGFPLKRLIHEGTGKYWDESLEDPTSHAEWIIMSNGDVGDPVYDALVKRGNSAFLKHYDLRARFQHVNVYELRPIPSEFVYRENNELYKDGKLFHFIGVNSYDLIYRSPQEITETLSKAKEAGFDVIRFWAFGDGTNIGPQPNAGIYNENRLQVLDQVLAIAKQQKLKVIVTFVNYWSDYGGIAAYLNWAGLPSQTPDDLDAFYTNVTTRNLYKNYIEHIVNRRNTVNNVEYKKDPTIMAWELMNEPRSASNSTSNKVLTWIDEMSENIRSIDNVHLIFSGHEGFLPNSQYTSTHTGPWFSQVGTLSSMSVLSGHYYLIDKKEVTENYRHPILSDWKQQADLLNKPLIIEEVGFSKNSKDNNNISREVIFQNLFEEIAGHGISGVILWNWALAIDDNYGISPNDPNDRELIRLIQRNAEIIRNKN